MPLIQSETLGERESFAKSLAKRLAESLGLNYMHDSWQDSLRDLFFLRGSDVKLAQDEYYFRRLGGMATASGLWRELASLGLVRSTVFFIEFFYCR